MIAPVVPAIALLIGLLWTPAAASVQERTLTDAEHQLVRSAATILVDVDSSTWRSRGRVSFAVGPAVREKLRTAGYTVVQDAREPHDLTMKVFYREERGRQFRADLYETDVRATLSLSHPTLGVLLMVRIDEFSSDDGMTNAPYVDVLHKIESNPYFYFLGDLVRGFLTARRDAAGTLIDGVNRLVDDEGLRRYPHVDTAALTEDPLAGPELLYGAQALGRTARELGALREARGVPVLTRLLEYPDRQVRISAVTALGQIRTETARSVLERAARQDRAPDVRAAAAEALARLPQPASAP